MTNHEKHIALGRALLAALALFLASVALWECGGGETQEERAQRRAAWVKACGVHGGFRHRQCEWLLGMEERWMAALDGAEDRAAAGNAIAMGLAIGAAAQGRRP